MHYFTQGIGLFLLLVISCQSLTAQEDDWLKIYADAEEDHVKIYWEPKGWPKNLRGFMVMKRQRIDSITFSEWKSLTNETIFPATTAERNWENQGLNESQQGILKEKYEYFIENGLVSSLEQEEMLRVLQENNGLGSGDRIRMKNDFELALVIGFACIDNDYDKDTICQYGVFPVYNTYMAENPASICELIPTTGLPLEVKFSRLKSGLSFEWAMSKKEAQNFALMGFYVYKSRKDTLNMDQAATSPLGPYRKTNDSLFWHFIDPLEDNDRDIYYGISFLNMFQEESPPIIKKFIAEKFRPLKNPVITIIELVNDKDIRINWQTDEADSSRITTAFIQMKRSIRNENYTLVSDTLDGSLRSFTDTMPRKYGEVYFFRVKVFDKYGNEAFSNVESIYYMGLIKPPKVKNAKARVLETDSGTYVHITWAPAVQWDSITEGYFIFSDEITPDTFLQLTNIPMINDTAYTHKILNQGGRNYKFRIVAASAHGAKAKPAEVSVYIDLLRLPRVSELNLKLLPANKVLATWEYPEIKGIEGFRLFMNGKLIDESRHLTDTSRAFFIDSIELSENNLVKFQIEAYSKTKASEKSLTQSLLITNYNPSSLPPPDSLAVSYIVRDSIPYAHLQWEQLDLDSAGIQGYILFVDYAFEGSVVRMSSLPLITNNCYYYKLPETAGRKRFTFRIAPMSVDREIGHYAEIILPLNETNNNKE